MKGRLGLILIALFAFSMVFSNTSCCSKHPSTPVGVVQAWLGAYETQNASAMVNLEQEL